jgi:hypothetical protein
MAAEPVAFGAFYRRFEDEVLGYFLARGATPEVAADLTAETFAAALPRRSWKRLADQARATMEASCREGRVVADARQRRHMPPLVLTDESVGRIAALERNTIAFASELRFDEQDDLRVRVVDESDFEQLATNLRLSGALVRRQATDPDPERDDTPRIPELEAALVEAAAHVRLRPRGAIVVATGMALAALGFILFAQDHSDHQPVSARAQQTLAAQFERTSVREIVRVGNAWATAFAASGPMSCVLDMTRTACERVICQSVDGPLENCSPLPRVVKSSFRGATVRDVVVNGRRAAARFSNGQVVEFVDGGPHSPWQVHGVGVRVGNGLLGRASSREEQVRRAGNAWAQWFAASDQPRCNRYMTQPACERVTCERMSGPIENCVVPTIRFRHSFQDATVEDVVVRGDRAAARFSNGEIVEFASGGPDNWMVHAFGRNAGWAIYQEARIERAGNAWRRRQMVG